MGRIASELKARLAGRRARTISRSGCVAASSMTSGSPAREHLLDLGVLARDRWADRAAARRRWRRRRSRRPPARARARCCTRSTLRDLGDAPHDREEDVAEVEGRRERLRELEDDLRVVLLARERLDDAAHAELAADARDELDRPEGLADEVVGARLEGLRDLVVGVERGEHDDGQVARLGRAPAGCAGPGSRRAAASPDRAARARAWTFSIRASASAPEPTATCGEPRARERLRQDVAADGVVVDDEDGAWPATRESCSRPRTGGNERRRCTSAPARRTSLRAAARPAVQESAPCPGPPSDAARRDGGGLPRCS